MRKHYDRILKDTDRRVKKSLRIQVMDVNSSYYGAFPDENDLMQVKFCIYRITSMIAAYNNEESSFYKNEETAKRILAGLLFTERNQHENGLFDFINCNFLSAPDTAFILKRILPCLHYLHDHEKDEYMEQVFTKMCSIVKKAARGLLEGGFHTPNHRWAIASNLMECADFFKNPILKEAAWDYLREGIDCNEDGEYAEKSAGTYNRINNDAMITIGKYLGDDSYFDHAVRNLHMMLTYIEPDGTIFTANSTRQDKGKRVYPKDYYWEYLWLGYKKNIPEFLDFANYIFDLIEENQITSPDFLIHFMNLPEMIDFEWEGSWKRKECYAFYQESGIIRAYREEYAYTVMQGKSSFLHFSNSSISISMKVAGAFCEHRAFVPDILETREKGIYLEQTMEGWYYLPMEEKPDTNDWWKMDHSLRKKKLGPDLKITALITEIADGLEIKLCLKGVEQAPFRVEIGVFGADKADNEHFVLQNLNGSSVLAKDGMTVFSNQEEALQVGPGFGVHSYTQGLFGSEAADKGGFTLYFTDYTEFEHTVLIKNSSTRI